MKISTLDESYTEIDLLCKLIYLSLIQGVVDFTQYNNILIKASQLLFSCSTNIFTFTIYSIYIVMCENCEIGSGKGLNWKNRKLFYSQI